MGEFAIGQRAAIYQGGYEVGGYVAATVERDTKLYWVANGRKFRKSDGLEPGSNSDWARGRYLLPLDDPNVIRAGIAARKSAAYSKVIKAQSELAKDRESLAAVDAVKSALDEYAKTI